MTFFMTTYLAQQFGIHVDPIVGYVNDGTGDIMISHAWIEIGGKKTDISLTVTEHPEAQLTGALLILDREMTRDRTVYTYHRERTPEAVRQLNELMKDIRFRDVLRTKESEHQSMVAVAKDLTLIREYHDAASDGLGYEQFARMIGTADL